MCFQIVPTRRPVAADTQSAYFSVKTQLNAVIMYELTFKQGVNGIKVVVRTNQKPMAPLAWTCMEKILQE